MDPSRLSKRKRSPKPRTKKNHSQQQPQATDNSKPQPPISENAEDPNECVAQMEVSEFEHIANDRVIATTPVAPTEEGVIDIAKSFEVCITCLSNKALHLPILTLVRIVSLLEQDVALW